MPRVGERVLSEEDLWVQRRVAALLRLGFPSGECEVEARQQYRRHLRDQDRARYEATRPKKQRGRNEDGLTSQQVAVIRALSQIGEGAAMNTARIIEWSNIPKSSVSRVIGSEKEKTRAKEKKPSLITMGYVEQDRVPIGDEKTTERVFSLTKLGRDYARQHNLEES